MKKSTTKTVAAAAPSDPGGTALAWIAALGGLSALWALFQWAELLVARMGGSSFCSINETFDCKAVWDSALATAVHDTSGVPVAGWGLAWGLIAAALPLIALARRANGRPVGDMLPAIQLMALAGGATVLLMAVASLAGGRVCLTCLVTYILVLAYVAVTISQRRWPSGTALIAGARTALLAVVAAYLLLLIPGENTPKASHREALAHLQKQPNAKVDPPSSGAWTQAAANSAQQKPPANPQADLLGRFLAGLPPPTRQAVSDSLHIYRTAPVVRERRPRALRGADNASVRVTEFTDVLCGHCAELHQTITELQRTLPPRALAVELRHFPLDSGCNPFIQTRPSEPVRCLAAKAQICMETHPKGLLFSGHLFENQNDLTEEKVYALAEPMMSRTALQACIGSQETTNRLAQDIAWAQAHNIEGTPLVLINGKRGTSFGPFLYAIALTGGNADHPAFAQLPPANARAHLH